MTFSKEAPIYHEGDPAQHWYEVDSGIVRTCRFLADGRRHLTGFYYPGDVFGVDQGIYQESAEAVTDAIVYCHSEHPGDAPAPAADARDDVLQKALENARRSIFLFGHRTAVNRLAAFLIELAERSGEGAGFDLPMTRRDIADHLNLTLHTVSRTMSDFARRRLIALTGPHTVQILDLDSLRIATGEGECGVEATGPTATRARGATGSCEWV
jgi:CRP/FNR family transcriptional regulator/CRP/FNR family nitrogen fixation transcriptional regulator